LDLSTSQTFHAAKTSSSVMGVYSYTTPAHGGFKHCETSRWCSSFGCYGRHMVNLICLFRKPHLVALL